MSTARDGAMGKAMTWDSVGIAATSFSIRLFGLESRGGNSRQLGFQAGTPAVGNLSPGEALRVDVDFDLLWIKSRSS
jgi:hypothetical protein